MRSLSAAVPSRTQSTGTSNGSKATAAEIAKYAKLLLGCFRAGDANDPDVYTGAVIAVLSDYPLDVIQQVVDPRKGLPSKVNWLPTIAEIKSACEEIEGPRRRSREWDEGAKKQLEQRKTLAVEDQRPRKTYEQIAAEFAEVGIIIGPKGRPQAATDLSELLTKYGITREQWDAVPTIAEDRAMRDSKGFR